MRALEGHSKDIRAVAYLPDGRVLSGGSDRSVRLWNPASGECLTTIKARGPVYAVAAAPEGGLFAYAGRAAPRAESNFVYLCDAAGTPAGRCELRTQEEVLERVPGSWELRRTMRCVPRSIWSLAFSADGKYLAAACRRPGSANIPSGGGGRCWAPDAAGEVIVLAEDTYALSFSPSGGLAVTGNRSVAFQAGPEQPEAVKYRLTSDWSAAVAVIPNAELAVVGTNSFLDFLNPVHNEKPMRLKTGIRTILAVAVTPPNGQTVLVAGKPGNIEVYDVAARTRTTAYDFGIGGVYALAYSPDGLTYAAGGDKGLVVCDVPG